MNKLYRFLLVLLVVAFIPSFLTSCSSGEQESKVQKATTSTEVATSTENIPVETEAANEPEGLKLMKASDCTTCHQHDVTVVGPSFKMIKEKYPLKDANVSDLSNKVIKGSVGVWGQVAMPNHPNLEKADAEKMVRYILSL